MSICIYTPQHIHSTVRARSCQAQVPLTWPTTPAPRARTRSGNGQRLLLCLTSSLGSLMCWRGARRLNVLPSRPDKLSRWVFFHRYCCLTSKLCPAESIISFKCSLNTYFIRRQSIPVYQVHVCKGPEVLTRDIYFYWRTSLKCLTNPKPIQCSTEFEVLTHRRREIRQQTPSATTSFVLILLELFQACRRTAEWLFTLYQVQGGEL